MRPKYPKFGDVSIPEFEMSFEDGYSVNNIKAEEDWLKEREGCQSLSNPDLVMLLSWCEEIACGLEFLGEKGILHVDMACRNVLLSASGQVKICDFGLSRKCLNEESAARSLLSVCHLPLNKSSLKFVIL